jgi:hypothetical protein
LNAIDAIRNIESPFKPINGLIPKVMYDSWGVFYDSGCNDFVAAEIVNGKIGYPVRVTPIGVIFPDEDGNYPVEEDDMHIMFESDICGEADDFSCYLYFNFCGSQT